MADWSKAAITTPAVAIRFHREGNTSKLFVRLRRAASLDVELPVRSTGITRVTVNGKPAAYETRSGFGETIMRVNTPTAAGETNEVALTTANTLPEAKPIEAKGVTGSKISLTLPDAANTTLIAISNPLGALTNASITGNAIVGTLSANTGCRRVFAKVKTGALEQTRILNLHMLPSPATSPPWPSRRCSR